MKKQKKKQNQNPTLKLTLQKATANHPTKSNRSKKEIVVRKKKINQIPKIK